VIISNIIALFSLNQKQRGFSSISLLLLLLVLGIVLLDAYQRFYTSDSEINKRVLLQDIQPIATAQLTKAQYAKITELYSQFHVQEDTQQELNSKLLSDEQQALQNGELLNVFVGTKMLKLRAVVFDKSNSNKAYAIIEIVDLPTNKLSTEKVSDFNEVEGFKVSITTNTKVSLSRTINGQLQQILLTMYKSN